ncbi:hypothetical protein QZH41_010994 [Actinostola sp. cb2023]|nr:hypothetical protein QZH41_010994 [Actinostola sp. cb2023]
MVGTFLCPNTCGFAKVVAVEVVRETSRSMLREKGESNTRYQARLKQYRSKVTYRVSCRLSRYEFIVSRYEFIVSRYEFIVSREKFIVSREKFIVSREKFIISREKFIVSREKFIVSRYEFIVSREEFIVSRYDKLASQCLICNVHFCMVTPFYKHHLKANSTFISHTSLSSRDTSLSYRKISLSSLVSRYEFIVSRYEFLVSRYEFLVSRYDKLVSRDDKLTHAMNCNLETLQTKQTSILKGAVSKHNSLQLKAKPLRGLSKKELEEKLASRGNFEDGTKKHLQNLLTEIMCGKQRVPALFFNIPEASPKTLCLDKYEILPCEPLHDIGHHIENFLTEFPNHLTEAESKVINECVEICLGNKDSKRTTDYRSTIVKTAALAHQSGIVSPKALSTIDILVEMQQILYSPDEKRTPALILRYYNQAWYHSILLKTAIDAPKKLTRRKMFGVYYHNLSAHAGLMLRLISGQAANAEAQERIFNSIKQITKQTSNNHPRQIITNLFIRLQAEKEMGLQGDDVSQQQAHISNLARSLPPATNTHIPLSIIKKHSREWQAHLQQISDYLKEGEGVWWSKTGDFVEFHDVTKHPLPQDTGPQLHHFRSTNLEKEAIRLEDCWIEYLTNQTVIPTHIIRIDQADGTTIRLYTNQLLQ